MLTGISFEKAIEYWKNGREVIVIDRNSQNASGGYDNFPFEELFRNVELLADVPAVENPEFKQAVADMVQQMPEIDVENGLVNGVSILGAKGTIGDPEGPDTSPKEESSTPPSLRTAGGE